VLVTAAVAGRVGVAGGDVGTEVPVAARLLASFCAAAVAVLSAATVATRWATNSGGMGTQPASRNNPRETRTGAQWRIRIERPLN
jgi:hypothetical protein